jgi:hypothetical protein
MLYGDSQPDPQQQIDQAVQALASRASTALKIAIVGIVLYWLTIAPGTRQIDNYWRPQYYTTEGAPVRAVSPAATSGWTPRPTLNITIQSANLVPQTPEQAAVTPAPAIVNPTPADTTAVATTSWFDDSTTLLGQTISNKVLAGGLALAAILFFGRKK